MESEKKYELCVSLQEQLITDLQAEFCVSTYTSNFPKFVSYENGEYTYDLDSIRIIFAYYFKENIIQFENAINRSKISFVKEVVKRIPTVKKNLSTIINERKFREQFLKKADEIKGKYFIDMDSKFYLKTKIEEFNSYLNSDDEYDFEIDEYREVFTDIFANFIEDMRKLKSIRVNIERGIKND